MERRFEFEEGNSSKFWKIEQIGAAVTTWWGRIGTLGQSKTKVLASEEAAIREYEKLISEKTRKGYQEVGGPQPVTASHQVNPCAAPATAEPVTVSESDSLAETTFDSSTIGADIGGAAILGLQAGARAIDAEEAFLNSKSPEILYYVKAGVPHAVIVEQLKVSERAVKEAALVHLSDSNQPVEQLLDELNLRASDMPQIKQRQMMVRGEELWCRTANSMSDLERKFLSILVDQVISGQKRSQAELSELLGPAGLIEFSSFCVRSLSFGLSEQDRIFADINASGIPHDSEQMEGEWQKVKAAMTKMPAPTASVPYVWANATRERVYEAMVRLSLGMSIEEICEKLEIPERDMLVLHSILLFDGIASGVSEIPASGMASPMLTMFCSRAEITVDRLPALKREYLIMRGKAVLSANGGTLSNRELEYLKRSADESIVPDPRALFTFAEDAYEEFQEKLSLLLVKEQVRILNSLKETVDSSVLSSLEEQLGILSNQMMFLEGADQSAPVTEAIDELKAKDVLQNLGLASVHISVEAKTLFDSLIEQVREQTPSKDALNPFAGMFGPEIKLSDYPAATAILKLSQEKQNQVLMAALLKILSMQEDRWGYSGTGEAVRQLIGRLVNKDMNVDEPQAALLVRAGAVLYSTGRELSAPGLLKSIDSAIGTERPPGDDLRRAIESYVAALSKGSRYYSSGPNSDGQKIIQKLRTVLARTPGGRQPLPIEPLEAWSDRAIADLDKVDDNARQSWIGLFDHCTKATGSKPSGTWLKKADEFVNKVGEDTFVLMLEQWLPLLSAKGTRTEGIVNQWEPDPAFTISAGNADILRGLIWICGKRKHPGLASALGDAAEASFKKVPNLGPRCPKVGNACVHSLSQMNTKEAVVQLSRVQSRAKHSSSKSQIDKALSNAAEQAGMSVDDLQDIGVPDFGIGADGRLVKQLGAWRAEITIETSDTTSLQWISDKGKTQQTVPSAVKSDFADDLKALKKVVSELDKLLPTVRSRIERSFIDQRKWRVDMWRERYLNHPVCSTIVRRLLWNFDGRAGFWHEGAFIDRDGSSFQPEESAQVELWHPIGSDPNTVLHWRQWLTAHEITQPFKQCHREIYVLTDAERQTATYSNRFARHIVRQHQLQHLCRQRGWDYQLMGTFDSQSTPTIDLPRWDMRVEFWVEPMEEVGEQNAGIFNVVATEQVRFLRRVQDPAQLEELKRLYGGVLPRKFKMMTEAFKYEEMQISEVTPVVFSEIMRDVDLFVSVCSIGTEPNRVFGRYGDYWLGFSFGELSEQAEVRKEVLSTLITKLKIAPRCRIDGKFLVVQGDLRTYKIHLGSANIQMEPNDEYLCIVAARGASAQQTNVFLPFEGDNVLALIISKAIMLADDKNIKDPSIVSQIKRQM
ncbi:MAG: DUF4132 domain-containing protein [Cyanobacteria bacterium]|nr:DUF4132 domain-containing protein [Cyanobacteriota bacterium]